MPKSLHIVASGYSIQLLLLLLLPPAHSSARRHASAMPPSHWLRQHQLLRWALHIPACLLRGAWWAGVPTCSLQAASAM